MKIKEIKVSYGRTINTGNYQSARFDVEYSATYTDGEELSVKKATEILHNTAKNRVNDAINLFWKEDED